MYGIFQGNVALIIRFSILFVDRSTRCWMAYPPFPFHCLPPLLSLLLQLRPLPLPRLSFRDRATSASPTRPGELLSTSTFSSAISLDRRNWLQVSPFHLKTSPLKIVSSLLVSSFTKRCSKSTLVSIFFQKSFEINYTFFCDDQSAKRNVIFVVSF